MKYKKEIPISWIGPQYECDIPSLRFKTTCFYKKCIFGHLTLNIGDYVMIINADLADPELHYNCDIARIEHMYEIVHNLNKDQRDDTHCAIVQWYSRVDKLPKNFTNKNDYSLDEKLEIIEDYRYNTTISLETILDKCKVIYCDNLVTVMNNSSKNVYICRYKLVRKSGQKNAKYELIAINSEESNGDDKGNRSTNKSITGNPTKTPTRKSSANNNDSAVKTPIIKLIRRKSIDDKIKEFSSAKISESQWLLDTSDSSKENYPYESNKVTPIKIIGGAIVQKSHSKSNTVDQTNDDVSPSKQPRLSSKRISMIENARKNLNASLNNEMNGTADSDILNYSIVERDTPEMKIKLRLSRNQTPNKRYSEEVVDSDYIPPSNTRRSVRKEVQDNRPNASDVTPRKTRKTSVSVDDKPQEAVPRMTRRSSVSFDDKPLDATPTSKSIVTRRKSILKTPNSKIDTYGTPKRNIQLSNIVEELDPKTSVRQYTPRKGDADNKTPNKTAKQTEELTRTPKSSRRTPNSKLKLIRSGALEPSIHNRETPSNNNANDFQLARERLHVSTVPKFLPCRQNEFADVYSFVKSKILDECGGCMYISGVPGTGKTATVTEVIKTLKKESAVDDLQKFEFIDINGMRLTEPRQAYVHFYKQLTGKTLPWKQAFNLLDKRFTTRAPRRITTVLLVDELDILCNRRQDVVYNLLNWPTMSTAQLVVITIANTMDLPERLLMSKITSRLGLTRLTFHPYSHKQLQEIVTSRLLGTEAFNSDAVQLVARKVAAVSGDARRALDICRRATEIAEASCKDGIHCPVSMNHVQVALSEMIASAKVQAIKSCSKLEKLFLQAVTAEVSRTGIEETLFLGVYTQLESLSAFYGISAPTPGKALSICSKLGSSRLLISEHSRTDIYQKIFLNVSSDDVHYALKDIVI